MKTYADTVPAHAHGIMFHHLHDGTAHLPRQGSLDPTTFGRLLDYVSASANLIPADEWQRRALSGRLRRDDVCLTFDDGLRCQYDLALPEIERRGLKAFFFVYSCVLDGDVDRLEIYAHFRHAYFDSMEAFYTAFADAVRRSAHGARVEEELARFDPSSYLIHAPFYSDGDRTFRYLRDRLLGPADYCAIMDRMIERAIPDRAGLAKRLSMGAAEVCDLHRRGHIVGLHSHSHPTDIRRLERADQLLEYRRCRESLAALLSTAPSCVAHPCGLYDDRTLSVLDELGISLGFRADFALTNGGPLEQPRTDHALVARSLAAPDTAS